MAKLDDNPLIHRPTDWMTDCFPSIFYSSTQTKQSQPPHPSLLQTRKIWTQCEHNECNLMHGRERYLLLITIPIDRDNIHREWTRKRRRRWELVWDKVEAMIMDRQTDGCMNGWMDEWIDEWVSFDDVTSYYDFFWKPSRVLFPRITQDTNQNSLISKFRQRDANEQKRKESWTQEIHPNNITGTTTEYLIPISFFYHHNVSLPMYMNQSKATTKKDNSHHHER